MGEPSERQKTSASAPGLARPKASRNSSCRRRCSRSTATPLGGNEMVRLPRLDLGGLYWSPALVSSRLRLTLILAPSRSQSVHFTALPHLGGIRTAEIEADDGPGMARRAAQVGRQGWQAAVGADRNARAPCPASGARTLCGERALARNVAGVIRPPAVEKGEIEILTATEVATALQKLQGHELYAITSTGLATGMRRGELLAYSSAITLSIKYEEPELSLDFHHQVCVGYRI